MTFQQATTNNQYVTRRACLMINNRQWFHTLCFYKGFSLIELLVVLSVIGIVATVGIASFVSYSRSSAVQQAALDVVTLLKDAKSRAQSQVKPSSCTGNLLGYQVDICGLPSSSCSTQNTYRLVVSCSNGTSVITTRNLPSSVSFTENGTTSTSYLFRVLTSGVVGSGDITLNGFNTSKVITVSASGTITVQ